MNNLTIRYDSPEAFGRRVLDNLSFHLDHRESVGLLGESGCGKTTLALALLGLLSPAARAVSGSIRFDELEILRASEKELQRFRGATASIVFQEPALALNPVLRVGDQIAEVVRAHTNCSRQASRKQVELSLAEVRLYDPRIYSAYPHQLSAGQRQRVVIAQALACKPSLLIADEPTSALDNTTQAEILNLFRDIQQRHALTLFFITHNPALLMGLADRVFVMYAGRIVEEGTLAQVYRNPRHPYTEGLLRSIPPLPERHEASHRHPLPAMEGTHSLSLTSQGCVFQCRCPYRVEICTRQEPALAEFPDGSRVRCFRYAD